MSKPNIRYYARLEYDKSGGKTPKYTITAQEGYYPPMDDLRGKDGRISMFLVGRTSDKNNAPEMRLQAKSSLNFTGLKQLFTRGDGLSGYAYGNPLPSETYGKPPKRNPFYDCRGDGFLFIIHFGNGTTPDGARVPDLIELIVLEDAKVFISAYCKQLQMGGFDEELKELRRHAEEQMFNLFTFFGNDVRQGENTLPQNGDDPRY